MRPGGSRRQYSQPARRRQHRLVADRRLQLPGPAEQLGVRGQARDGAGTAGRAVHPSADHQRVAHGLAGVDVQAGRRARREPPHAKQQLGSGHGVDVRGHRHRQAQRVGQHRPDGRLAPAQPGVVDVAGGAVDGATDRDPDPERPPPMPAPQVPGRALGQRRQRGVPAGLSGVGVSTVSSVRPNRSVATMLVVRAPMWMPSVTNGSWLISTGTRGARWPRRRPGRRVPAANPRRAAR